MTQLSGNQFEDDLTVDMEESNDSIDMFGISGDDESPIAQLKSIILSIDWEINDEILKQLEDELLDLGEIWAGDKIKQVYVQGLSKIGKYIFKEKASAHPDAIKLLLSFYHNLEVIVLSDENMGEGEKRKLLLSDVQKFDQLKGQIGQPSETGEADADVESTETKPSTAAGGSIQNKENIHELKGLKAQVLGIDWEINDVELEKLGDEVKRLEVVFADDRPKIILLQGIGSLSAYINKMRSKSKNEAFVLLHSFYEVLEKVSGNTLSAPEQKKLLLAEVSKFKEFKVAIAGDAPPSAAVSEVIATPEDKDLPQEIPVVAEESPAAMSATETEPDAKIALAEDDVASDVSSRLSSVFGEDEMVTDEYGDSDKNKALEGVNVETEADDESEEDALPFEDGGVSPALAEIDEDSSFSVEKLAGDLSVASPTVTPDAIVGDDIEADDDVLDVEDVGGDATEEDSTVMGVDVETEADDDSDEESLPMSDGALAPALSGADDDGGFDESSMSSDFDDEGSEAIESRLGDFFDDEVASSSEGWGAEIEEEISQADDDTPGDEDGLIAALSEAFDETEGDTEVEGEQILEADDESLVAEEGLAAALSAFDEVEEESTEQALFDDEEDVAGLSDFGDDDDAADQALDFTDENPEDEESLVAALSQFDDADESVTATVSDDIVDIEENVSDPEPALFQEDTGDDEHEIEEIGVVAAASELAFLDEEPELESSQDSTAEDSLPAADMDSDDTIAFEVESDDLSDDDEITFSVPGVEVAESLTITDDTENEEDDLIQFEVPGESGETAAIALAEDDADSEVVFEAVADDVAVDLLPGEEFDDTEAYSDSVEESPEEDVFDSDSGKYESLAILGGTLAKNITEDGIQDLFVELNKIRGAKETSYIDKTFLQLLSTVCQYLEKDQNSENGIALMQEIVSGLEMSDNSEVSSDRVQESLFSSTSRLLVLQREEMDLLMAEHSQSLDDTEQTDAEQDTMDETSDESGTEKQSFKAAGDDEQLASFVQKELADIRKLFVDEIGSLRKELSGK